MFRKTRQALFLLALSIGTSNAVTAEDLRSAAFTIADTRTELSGRWQGKLEYRDYRANRWFGIPTTVEVELIDDNATVVRKATFDDGDSGLVYITTVSMIAPDGKNEYVGSFRADRPAEIGSFSLRLAENMNGKTLDASHWTVVATTDGTDDDRPATIRETTTRNGQNLVTLKEVDYRDDEKEEWLQRNRTVLEKIEN